MIRAWLCAVALLSACGPETTPIRTDGPLTETGTGDDDDDDDNGDDDDDDSGPRSWVSKRVGSPNGPTFATIVDLDDDGTLDLVVSSLGEVTAGSAPPGLVTVYTPPADLSDAWTATDVLTAASAVVYPNHTTPHDFDNDGDLDLLLPTGGRFCGTVPAIPVCGGMRWLVNPGRVEADWPNQVVYQGLTPYFTSAVLADLNGDGNEELVTSAEVYDTSTALQVYSPTGVGMFGPPASYLGGGAWPVARDVDGDSDLDVLLGEQLTNDSFSWFENNGGALTRRVIASDLGDGWQIELVDDLFGDGEVRAVATNHTNTQSTELPDVVDSQVVAFTIPADPRQPWTERVTISEGILAFPDVPLLPVNAPGVFATGDVDGDGDLDVVVAGDGDPNVYLLTQGPAGSFTTEILGAGIAGSAGTGVADFDGDGDLEIVVLSERDDTVFVLEYR